MAPAEVSEPTQTQIKNANRQSIKVLEELMKKLNVSKSEDEINASSQEIAIFINGDIEEEDAPTT